MKRTAVDPLEKKAVKAMNEAVEQVVERHLKEHRKLAVWQGGRVARIEAASVRKAAGR
jgi:fumarate hydratase class II